MSRRRFLEQGLGLVAAWSLLGTLAGAGAFAKEPSRDVEVWFRQLDEACRDLKTHVLPPTEWQSRLDALDARISLAEILSFIDFETLTRGLEFRPDQATVRDVVFPAIAGLPAK